MKTSKTLLAIAIYAALGVWLATPAHGQTLRANVPFAFHVGDQSMPAGEYLLRVEPGARSVTVETTSGLARIRFYAVMEKAPAGPEACLVFEKLGNQMFLHLVKTPLANSGLKAPAGKKERQLERVARLNRSMEVATVQVAAW